MRTADPEEVSDPDIRDMGTAIVGEEKPEQERPDKSEEDSPRLKLFTTVGAQRQPKGVCGWATKLDGHLERELRVAVILGGGGGAETAREHATPGAICSINCCAPDRHPETPQRRARRQRTRDLPVTRSRRRGPGRRDGVAPYESCGWCGCSDRGLVSRGSCEELLAHGAWISWIPTGRPTEVPRTFRPSEGCREVLQERRDCASLTYG
ncbi:hypothetical protein NDU88_003201 [Pleurodeles waltl]|uniref:Uncharacterized protein n=1 Tax=Pleurodeles waltl TaxID=8319 RepID=A0AAV7QC20_PLEWA|nr:hypothetical protein NDU88_003201 [Pleurodeles waltl]